MLQKKSFQAHCAGFGTAWVKISRDLPGMPGFAPLSIGHMRLKPDQRLAAVAKQEGVAAKFIMTDLPERRQEVRFQADRITAHFCAQHFAKPDVVFVFQRIIPADPVAAGMTGETLILR